MVITKKLISMGKRWFSQYNKWEFDIFGAVEDYIKNLVGFMLSKRVSRKIKAVVFVLAQNA